MGTITTTTQATPLSYPSAPTIARDHTTGYQYAIVRNSAGNWEFRDSVDGGSNWTLLGTLTRANIVEWSGIVVDRYDWLHFCYRTNESSEDRIYYRRFNIDTLVLSGEVLMSQNGNGGVAGAVWQGLDLGVVRHWNGAYAIIVAGTYTNGTSSYGMVTSGVSIDTGGNPYLNHPIIQNNRFWLVSGVAPGRAGLSLELEHNGDGQISSTPHAWVTWGRTTLNMVRVSWVSSEVGWQGPQSHQIIDTPIPAQDYISARWDGSRFLMASINPDLTTTVAVYERNRANTTTTIRTTPVHPAGVVRQVAISYNRDGDIRVYAVGTSSTVLYFVTYSRAAGTWGVWATVSATAILGATGGQFAVRRGGTFYNNRYDVITAHSGSPNTVLSTSQTVTSPPNTPTWDTTGQPYTNGGAADTAATLTLDWTFVDPDPTDTQAHYAVSRQIGAGALSYWRASDSTWQATEQQNASGTSALTLSASWGAGTDANHTYKAKVWDSAGSSSGYSAGLVLVPSVKVNPAITAPTAAQVLGVNTVTVTWTATEQTAYRVVLKQTTPTSATRYDSGFVTDAALRSLVVPYTLPDGTGWTVELTTKNVEGLASTTQTRSFTVDYIEPATPTLVVLPITASGINRVTVTNPTPSGGQPALLYQDLYRKSTGAADSTAVRIRAGLASAPVVDDWGAAARTPYEYRVTAYGVNGTQINSAWTA